MMTPDKLVAARKLLASGMTAHEVASAVAVSVLTLYRHLSKTGPAAARSPQQAA